MSRELRIRVGAAAVLMLVFGAGIALGFSLDGRGQPSVQSTLPSLGPLADDASAPSDWIVDRLDLSAQQRAAVDSIVQHYGAKMGALQKKYRPLYRAIVDSTADALRALLDEHQRATYDSLEAEAQRRRFHGASEGHTP